MTATPALTTDLKTQVKILADDLRQRLDTDSERLAEWKDIHQEAVTKDRTAMSWVDWREDRIDQAAVAWVLTTVFLRFCEDNSLAKPVWFSGQGNRRQEALDGYNAYFRSNPEHSDREWLESAISYLRRLPATKALVDAHSALEYVAPSGNAIGKLREFWLRRNDDDGTLQHDLRDDALSTRFLGDLYQDLSEYAKEKYALLQTPVFVEEFILDRTLEPALNDRPLDGFRMIDPTCGSGHFLLGSFTRLLDRWHKQAPGMEIQARVQTALDAIHGVDLNPFAIAIARFRLTVEALRACELRLLEDAPAFKFHLAVGDSLIHGPDANVIPGLEDRSSFMPFHYPIEDASALLDILETGRYDAVVGNPPYIQARDKSLNKIYRSKFSAVCSGKYSLTVPFMAQFFALAKASDNAGWVGQITSKSFMKREFGAKLVENFLSRQDLRQIVDTSRAYIPGHGTPTAIIVGRNRQPVESTVRAVLGVKGEPERPEIPANGIVWRDIVDHIDDKSWDDGWITVTDLDRELLAHHPWSLSGGGAIDLLQQIESANKQTLGGRTSEIGVVAVIGEEEAFELQPNSVEPSIEIVLGDLVRDFCFSSVRRFWPYDEAYHVTREAEQSRTMWPFRRLVSGYLMFGKTREERGKSWLEYGMLAESKLRSPLSIVYAEQATLNHFALDRSGKVFTQTSPVIKLRQSATEDEHIALFGVLNSSTVCFWLKQRCQEKPSNGVKRGHESEAWTVWYQFNAANVKDCPIPAQLPVELGRVIDSLANELMRSRPGSVLDRELPSKDVLEQARATYIATRGRMIAVQEELDWETYWLYGLTEERLTIDGDDLPELELGERPFEITLARESLNGEQTAWFERHNSAPITEIPSHLSQEYRQLTQKRLNAIKNIKYIQLLEKPENKRRWLEDSWDEQQESAVRKWLFDQMEDRRFWFDRQGRPSPKSVAQLADEVTRNVTLIAALQLREGRPDIAVSDSLKRLLLEEAIPFLGAYRYKESGLRKYDSWEDTWAIQRHQDAGEKVENFPAPPRYARTDFQKASYWDLRGPLDVPKERFILYPDASRDGDGTSLLGWAGWDHAEQALALASVINDREQEGWPDEKLVPLVAGLAELQPWVDQWHGDVHPTYGVSLAAFCSEELTRRAAQVGMTIDQLRWWRPEKKQRKGRGKA